MINVRGNGVGADYVKLMAKRYPAWAAVVERDGAEVWADRLSRHEKWRPREQRIRCRQYERLCADCGTLFIASDYRVIFCRDCRERRRQEGFRRWQAARKKLNGRQTTSARAE